MLEVPVACADRLIVELAGRYRQWRTVRAPASGAHIAHVSIGRVVGHVPSVGLQERVAEVCSQLAAFDFTLARIGSFAGGVVHLEPEPERPFSDLINRFGSMAAVDGAFIERAPGKPHVTLSYLSETTDFAALTTYVSAMLPMRGVAGEIDLVLLEPGRRTLFRRIPFRRH